MDGGNMGTGDSAVNICMITDDNYIMPTAVAIHSMIANKKRGKYNYYIITSNLSEESEKTFKKFEREDVSVNICRENAEKRFNGMHIFTKDSICVASLSALLKFIIPDLFPELDKILYLDGDLIVTTDLQELYSTDLEDNLVAAVVDSGTMYWKNKFNSAVQHYFNSGVMLLNLKKMREDNISRVLIETKSNISDSSLMDQNVFNLVFDGKLKLLPIKYNVLPPGLEKANFKWGIDDVNRYYRTNYKNEEELFLDAEIIHFSSKDKPWREPDSAFAYLWRHYYLDLYGKDKPKREEKYGISVIMPCYNSANYLRETVDSILNQTFKDFEIILIDDGSTDETKEMINELAEKHDNISAYFHTNHGQGYERNFGITKAQGKYIHFMDSDDLLEPNCYEKLYTYAEENDLDNILFEGKSFYETEELEKKMPQYKTCYTRKLVFPRIYNGEELFIQFRSSVGMIVSPCLQMIKRSFLIENSIYFPQLPNYEDNLFTFKAITQADRIAVLPYAFFSRRVRANSTMTSSQSKDAVKAFVYTVSEIMKVYIHNSDRYDFSTAVFNHAVLMCKSVKRYYYETCIAEGKDDVIDEFGDIGREIIFCLFIAEAKESSNMNKYTTVEYRNLYSRLCKANKNISELNDKLQKTYKEKSEINAKLHKTYKEKSEINAKLQKTYKEKSAKTRQIKRLEKWSLYPLLRKIKRMLKKIFKGI